MSILISFGNHYKLAVTRISGALVIGLVFCAIFVLPFRGEDLFLAIERSATRRGGCDAANAKS